MGTRNLTIVINNQQPKIAQYGQWDGYPSGVGVGILLFLSDLNKVDALKAKISRIRFLDPDGVDKLLLGNYQKNAPSWSSDPDNRTPEQKRWWSLFQSRDLADEVLENIINNNDEEFVLQNSYGFAADSLFCEYCYVIDFDKDTFEVYEGFNKTPLTQEDRFYEIDKEGSEYHPVRLIKSYDLNDLPTKDTFLKELERSDDL